jgi:hypothetical protein
MGCFSDSGNKPPKKLSTRAKKELQNKEARQQFTEAQGPWYQERTKNQHDKRTRTYPEGGHNWKYPKTNEMKLNTREDHTIFFAHKRSDLKLPNGLRPDQYISEQEVRNALRNAPAPGHPQTPRGYPHAYQNKENILPIQSSNASYYYEYPVTAPNHTRGHGFDYSQKHGSKTGPWRGITDVNQNYVGTIVHNPPVPEQYKNGFFVPQTHLLGRTDEDDQRHYAPRPVVRRNQSQDQSWRVPQQHTRKGKGRIS